jgi:hypothetical protein
MTRPPGFETLLSVTNRNERDARYDYQGQGGAGRAFLLQLRSTLRHCASCLSPYGGKALTGAVLLRGLLAQIRSGANEIEARANRRLADEYDAAQERGEIRTQRDNQAFSETEKASGPSIIPPKELHEARIIRDAECAPGTRRGFTLAQTSTGDRCHSAMRTESKNQGRPIALTALREWHPIGISTFLNSRKSRRGDLRGKGDSSQYRPREQEPHGLARGDFLVLWRF